MFVVLYYALLKPLSNAPSWLLYRISDFLSALLYFGGFYRKKLVIRQISDSFPEKSKEEVLQITRNFYSHFCDLMVESLMIFSISKEDAISRCKITSSKLFNELYDDNRNIIIVGGHFNNWEMLAVAIDAQVPHQTMALYTPLANKSFDNLMRRSRGKYGLRLYPKKKFWEIFEAIGGKPFAAIFGADQFPTRSKNIYWTDFLCQETAVAFGTEKCAKLYNCAVVFGRIIKLKRGFYEMDFQLITKDPTNEPFGAITQKHVAMLEADIRANPQYWLWTHRRWKRKRPADAPFYPASPQSAINSSADRPASA